LTSHREVLLVATLADVPPSGPSYDPAPAPAFIPRSARHTAATGACRDRMTWPPLLANGRLIGLQQESATMTRTRSRYLSVQQAASRTSVSVETIRRHLKAGRFPNARRATPGTPSCPWRIPESDLAAAGLVLHDAEPSGDAAETRRAIAAEPAKEPTAVPPLHAQQPLHAWVGELLAANQKLIEANSRLSSDNAELAARWADLALRLAVTAGSTGLDHLRNAS